MSRIVCWFSCGAASAVSTKLAIAQYQDREIVIARCIVKEEHPDNDRFAADCEKWFGRSITNLIAEEYDGSVYNVIAKRKYISGVDGAPCTMLLKRKSERISSNRTTSMFLVTAPRNKTVTTASLMPTTSTAKRR